MEGLITGWRDEFYPVVQSFHDEPVFLVERAAAAHFGIKAYGEGGKDREGREGREWEKACFICWGRWPAEPDGPSSLDVE